MIVRQSLKGCPVYAVIPTWKRERMCARAVESLREHAPELTDIIVVEGVSPIFKARNVGVEAVREKDAIILMMDDDIFYDEHLRLSETLARWEARFGVVQLGWIRPDWPTFAMPVVKTLRPSPFFWMGGGFLFKRSLWAEVGGYHDEYLDDIAFCAESYRLGFENVHSEHSWGHHENDNPNGGLAESAVFSQSNMAKYGIGGQPWHTRGGVTTIYANFVTPDLRLEHIESARKRFGSEVDADAYAAAVSKL